jgi:hypothetical protein
VENRFITITQDWVTNLNIGVEILAFCMDGHSYQAYIVNEIIGVNHPMCKDVFLASITQVKA